MKVESGQSGVDFRESREKALATPPLPVGPWCGVCGHRLHRMGPSENYQCDRGHQTTAKRLQEEGR